MRQVDENASEKSKSDMIRAVLNTDPTLAAPTVQAAVWDRFSGEVTAQEIARVRKKMRQAGSADADKAAVPKPRSASRRTGSKAAGRKKRDPVRATDFEGADVTVKQLSAILEVAEEVGGLRRLHDALRTVMLLREKVGAVDERQLAYALDFLGRLTGRK
jgi:hypothetical protein